MYTEATGVTISTDQQEGQCTRPLAFLIIRTLCVVIRTPWIVHCLRLDEELHQKMPRVGLRLGGENREMIWSTRDGQEPASVPKHRFFCSQDRPMARVLA